MRIVSKVSLGLMIVIGTWRPSCRRGKFRTRERDAQGPQIFARRATAPAGKPIIIDVSNLNSTPSEFESKTLRVEKVVPGGGKISIQVRPLVGWPLSLLRRLS